MEHHSVWRAGKREKVGERELGSKKGGPIQSKEKAPTMEGREALRAGTGCGLAQISALHQLPVGKSVSHLQRVHFSPPAVRCVPPHNLHWVWKPLELLSTYCCFCQFSLSLDDIILKVNYIMQLKWNRMYHLSYIEADHQNKYKETKK